jgi:hypothetical protein
MKQSECGLRIRTLDLLPRIVAPRNRPPMRTGIGFPDSQDERHLQLRTVSPYMRNCPSFLQLLMHEFLAGAWEHAARIEISREVAAEMRTVGPRLHLYDDPIEVLSNMRRMSGPGIWLPGDLIASNALPGRPQDVLLPHEPLGSSLNFLVYLMLERCPGKKRLHRRRNYGSDRLGD